MACGPNGAAPHDDPRQPRGRSRAVPGASTSADPVHARRAPRWGRDRGLAPGPVVAMPGRILPPEARAFGTGVFYSVYYVQMMLVPPLAGTIADRVGDVGVAFILGGLMMALAVFVGTATPPRTAGTLGLQADCPTALEELAGGAVRPVNLQGRRRSEASASQPHRTTAVDDRCRSGPSIGWRMTTPKTSAARGRSGADRHSGVCGPNGELLQSRKAARSARETSNGVAANDRFNSVHLAMLERPLSRRSAAAPRLVLRFGVRAAEKFVCTCISLLCPDTVEKVRCLAFGALIHSF